MSKFLSLDWFKSKVENSVEQVISKRLDKLIDEIEDDENNSSTKVNMCKKPYKNLTLVNDVLTIMLNDGSILCKPTATAEDFEKVRMATSEEELIIIVSDPSVLAERKEIQKEAIKISAINKGMQYLSQLKDFTLDDDCLYLKGTSRTIPQLLVERFFEVVGAIDNELYFEDSLQEAVDADEEFQSLKRFFMWCCLNPRAEVANELYRFLDENSFRITKQGFFVALRNVVTLNPGETELVKFISNAYQKIKAVWKKSPSDYVIVQTGSFYNLEKKGKSNKNVIGSLDKLYTDLPNMKENRFTDDWTKTFDIRIGKVVEMPMDKCNWSTQDCAAAGLHFTSDEIHYVGCGDTSILVLINPMKVVGIGQHKGRCYEYLPIMTVPREEATQILHDVSFDTLELDEDYANEQLAQLVEKVKQGFTAETKKHQFNLPQISSKEINTLVSSLSEMKKKIKNRVNKI